jgi:hypothetical protein
MLDHDTRELVVAHRGLVTLKRKAVRKRHAAHVRFDRLHA